LQAILSRYHISIAQYWPILSLSQHRLWVAWHSQTSTSLSLPPSSRQSPKRFSFLHLILFSRVVLYLHATKGKVEWCFSCTQLSTELSGAIPARISFIRTREVLPLHTDSRRGEGWSWATVVPEIRSQHPSCFVIYLNFMLYSAQSQVFLDATCRLCLAAIIPSLCSTHFAGFLQRL